MVKHYKQKNKKIIFILILRIIFFIALIVSTVYIAKWCIDNKQNEILQKKMQAAISIENTQDNEESYKIDFEKLKEINNQVVAWLKVKGTNIEYAIVKSDNNSYYLDHNFEKKYNSAGWIFADYKNKFDGTDKNIVIYGHNRKDNSMFGSLKNILTEEWYSNNENLIIDFITENEYQKYQVFSLYKIEKEDYYISTEFKKNEFAEFIDKLKDRSIKDFNIDVSTEDSILTLSTCDDSNKYRVVLHAKKIKQKYYNNYL